MLIKRGKINIMGLTQNETQSGVICVTLDDLRQSAQIFVSPADVAPILQCDPQCIRKQAQTDPSKLGFPVVV